MKLVPSRNILVQDTLAWRCPMNSATSSMHICAGPRFSSTVRACNCDSMKWKFSNRLPRLIIYPVWLDICMGTHATFLQKLLLLRLPNQFDKRQQERKALKVKLYFNKIDPIQSWLIGKNNWHTVSLAQRCIHTHGIRSNPLSRRGFSTSGPSNQTLHVCHS